MSAAGPMPCAKHPKEQTLLRCAGCNTPICDKCAVLTPVGYKCRSCGTYKNPAAASPTFLRILLVLIIGLLGGLLAGLIVPSIGFFAIWVALPYGRFLGSMVLRASNQRVGMVMEILTGGSILVGGLSEQAISLYMQIQAYRDLITHNPSAAAHLSSTGGFSALFTIIPAVIVVVIAGAAISRLRWSWSYLGF